MDLCLAKCMGTLPCSDNGKVTDMVFSVKTPLLQEAETLLGALPRGGLKKFAEQIGWSEGRLRQIAKGMQPTGSRALGSGLQQIQRVVYELRRMSSTLIPDCPLCGKPMQFKKQGYSDDLGCEVRLYHCDGPSPGGGNCFAQKRVPVTAEQVAQIH